MCTINLKNKFIRSDKQIAKGSFGLWRLLLMALCSLCSCKKFVAIDPPSTQIISSTVFTSDASATAAMSGVYSTLMSTEFGIANSGITLYAGLSGDDLVNYSSNTAQMEFYNNALTPSNGIIKNLWAEAYKDIYAVNSILEGLSSSNNITNKTKNHLEGEAYFLRAFLHFYLVNLFGPVPYATSTDYRTNTDLPRLPEKEVLQKIINDLIQAQTLITEEYTTTERVRPNKWAATALLARVYLYAGDWANAEKQATLVLNNSSQYSLVSDLSGVFLKSSREAIWQLMPVLPSRNTNEGYYFVLNGTPSYAALSPGLLSAFENGDKRKSSWTSSATVGTATYTVPFKYKIKNSGAPLSEYYTVLRLAETYLIRSEARAHLEDFEGAIQDLNLIRQRAGLPALSGTIDKASILAAIGQERRVELFAEWGHRWLDLKRTGKADAVLSALKPNWQLTDTLYPIPLIQLQNDPSMTQNPGY